MPDNRHVARANAVRRANDPSRKVGALDGGRKHKLLLGVERYALLYQQVCVTVKLL